ncbi:MAG: TrkA C-terminal domain-containing protein, partial [Dehalococcoidia bacterium]|nr:TrkA C-terminal domain-containing protein [Dehalococcoidia bacterium]
VLVTIILKQLGVRYIVARADTKLHGAILQKIGVNKVVYVEHEMGVALAHGLVLSDVSDYVSVAANYGVVKLIAPSPFVGKSFSQLQLGWKGKFKVAVLLVKRGKEVIVSPDLKEVVQADDVLILSGNDDELERALSWAEKPSTEETKASPSAS